MKITPRSAVRRVVHCCAVDVEQIRLAYLTKTAKMHKELRDQKSLSTLSMQAYQRKHEVVQAQHFGVILKCCLFLCTTDLL